MISSAIMAHPRRRRWIPRLAERIGADVQVVWDEKQDRWDTGRRSLLAYNPDASHHLVIQDDALVCLDLVLSLDRAVKVSQDHPVSCYMGAVRPHQPVVEKACGQAKQVRASWVSMPGPWWGPGILVPTGHIEEIVEYGDGRRDIKNYDLKIEHYYRNAGMLCWYTWPSLVDHRHGVKQDGTPANPSMVKGRTSVNRFAHRFLGEHKSAMSIDWSGPVVDGPALAGTKVT